MADHKKHNSLRKCWRCHRTLTIDEFCYSNASLSFEELNQLWNNPYIQLFCCSCYDTAMKQLKSKEEMKYLRAMEDKEVAKIKQTLPPDERELIYYIENDLHELLPLMNSSKENLKGFMVKDSRLTELYLSNCRILMPIPEIIGNSSALTILYLNNSGYRRIPDSIGNLRNLKELYLGGSNLESLPETIGSLRSLRVLDLSNRSFSSIKELPDSIGSLKALKYLNLRGHKNIFLPESMKDLTSLEYLNLGYTELYEIPEIIYELKSLKTLILKNNIITKIGSKIENLSSLTWLDLSNNSVQYIPQGLSNLKSMERLILDNNEITEIPEFIRDFEHLVEIKLAGNRIQQFPVFLKGLKKIVLFNDLKKALYRCFGHRANNIIKLIEKGKSKVIKTDRSHFNIEL